MGKGHTASDNIDALKEAKDSGIWTHSMMIQGVDSDTPDTLAYTSEILNKYAGSIQVFPPIPIPGTTLFLDMLRQKRIIDVPFHLYDGHYVISKSNHFSPLELQLAINQIYANFYTSRRRKDLVKELRGTEGGTSKLLTYKNIAMGICNSLRSHQMQHHLDFLRSVG